MLREFLSKNPIFFGMVTLFCVASWSSACSRTEFGSRSGRIVRSSSTIATSSTLTSTSTSTGTSSRLDSEVGSTMPGNEKSDVASDDEGAMTGSGSSGIRKDTLTREVEFASFESFWTVTMQGVVTYYKLNGRKVDSTKRWTFSIPSNGAGGARTYVTEGGLVFAKPRGHLYWVDPEKTPEGALPEETHHRYYPELDTEGGALGRACVVSYKKSGGRYVGAGFGLGNFIEIKLADKYPYEPLWSEYRIIRPATPGSEWGYSCFIDQKKMIYYGKTVSGIPQALALLASGPLSVAATVAPNGGFVSGNPDLQRYMYDTVGGGSYVLAGGVNGQVFNVQGAYAFADDKKGLVWGSFMDGNRIFVSKSDCLSANKPCQRDIDFLEQTLMMGRIGPLSALKSGNLIALARGSGEIYYLSMLDRGAFSKGVELLRIGTSEGDPYMYTDFTGSTLYDTSFQLYRLLLNDSDIFDPNLPIAKLQLTTIPHIGEALDWTGYEMQVRCYNSKSDPPGEFVALPDTAATLKGVALPVSMCQGSVIDEVQIRIKKTDENAQLLRIKALSIGFEQSF